MLVKTADLSPGEKLLIQRRRDGYTQHEAAKKNKVSPHVYRLWEQGEGEVPKASVGKLSDAERCYISRKRAGMSVNDLAKKMKISRWWICSMEAGRAQIDDLKKYWES